VNSTDPALYDRSKTQWIPLGVGYRSQDFDRTRRGDYAAFQWRPNKDLTSTLTYFKTKYKEDLDEHVVASSEDKWYQQVASSNAVFDRTAHSRAAPSRTRPMAVRRSTARSVSTPVNRAPATCR
jgi:hypothetical protein